MTTAFVLSGGGSLGAVQVGMLQALGERGVVPDLLVGTSAGAINAAFVGGHEMGTAALLELAGLWRSLRRRDLFALRPLHGVLAVAGVSPSLFSAEPLRRLVEANLGYGDLLDASIELHLVTTDLSSGREVMLSSGDAASAVVASAAIPGVFPPVWREGVACSSTAASPSMPRSVTPLGAEPTRSTSCRQGSLVHLSPHPPRRLGWPCRR